MLKINNYDTNQEADNCSRSIRKTTSPHDVVWVSLMLTLNMYFPITCSSNMEKPTKNLLVQRNNRNTTKTCEISSNLTIKKRCHWPIIQLQRFSEPWVTYGCSSLLTDDLHLKNYFKTFEEPLLKQK